MSTLPNHGQRQTVTWSTHLVEAPVNKLPYPNQQYYQGPNHPTRVVEPIKQNRPIDMIVMTHYNASTITSLIPIQWD